jgi:phosphonopyruvate decarboxylase
VIDANVLVRAARALGVRTWAGVPCSFLGPLISTLEQSPEARWVNAVNEADAVAVACGSELAGTPAALVMQNSGLGNAVDPLTSLAHPFRIPLLLIVSVRGQPGGPADAEHHGLMGSITGGLLDLMRIPTEVLPTSDADAVAAVERAGIHLSAGRSAALLVHKGTFQARPAPIAAPPSPAPAAKIERGPTGQAHKRVEVLRALVAGARPDDIFITTTGFTSREFLGLSAPQAHFPVVGSMGCAAGLGLGLALEQPRRRVVIIDGDGSVLMRMGALAMVGQLRPPNLVHVVLDNGVYESTGNQRTLAPGVDFAGVAAATGYARVATCADTARLAEALSGTSDGPSFFHVPIAPGLGDSSPRPELPLPEVAARFRARLAERSP